MLNLFADLTRVGIEDNVLRREYHTLFTPVQGGRAIHVDVASQRVRVFEEHTQRVVANSVQYVVNFATAHPACEFAREGCLTPG